MVSALVCGSNCLGLSLGPRRCVVFLGKILTPPFSAQVYKWVLANLILLVKYSISLAIVAGHRNNQILKKKAENEPSLVNESKIRLQPGWEQPLRKRDIISHTS